MARSTKGTGEQEKNAESRRLQQAQDITAPWKHWGPYLSERQWGADINIETGIS